MNRLVHALLCILSVAPSVSIACSVVVMPGQKVSEPTTAERVTVADAIFIAHIEYVSRFRAVNDADKEPFGPMLVVGFRMVEPIKGKPQEPRTIYVSSNSCGPPPPEVGSDVLLWVHRDPRTGRDVLAGFPSEAGADSPYLQDVRRAAAELDAKASEKRR
ncbi:hypothetical protein [Arenimonas sp.]|uniref:hypothetical protein n=1 Tax=Arenimonas sp. TaxID=1872635 RepID=UPI0039E5933C